MFVYLVTGPSAKRYVGITSVGIAERWKQHISAAKACRHKSALHAAIRKYGEAAFTIDQIGSAETWKELCSMERSAIAKYGTFGPGGYNLTLGGDGTPGCRYADRPQESRESLERKIVEANARRTPVEQARIAEAISASKRGKARPKDVVERIAAAKRGKRPSDEAIAKTAAANRGQKRSSEMRSKMSSIAKARSAESMANFTGCRSGTEHTAEARAKMSEAATARREKTAETMREIWRQRKAARVEVGGAV